MYYKRRSKKNLPDLLSGPLLDSVVMKPISIENVTHHPFSLPIIKNFSKIDFPTSVTFFVGENGSGKSTILEAIAHNAGFGVEGGSKHINFKTSKDSVYAAAQQLSDQLILSWRRKPMDGYFFRAESFYNIANYLDTLGSDAYVPYGGKSLHEQSHGESFFAFFRNRVGSGGFFILDEPEAALSPQRQLSLLVIMKELSKVNTQFVVATHSPLLLAFPQATIYSCDGDYLRKIDYHDTSQYQITKEFLNNTERYLKNLFLDE